MARARARSWVDPKVQATFASMGVSFPNDALGAHVAAAATSWLEKGMQDLMNRDGVHWVKGDMYQYGMTQSVDGVETAVKKPTGFLTNSQSIANRLSMKCRGMHRHITPIGG